MKRSAVTNGPKFGNYQIWSESTKPPVGRNRRTTDETVAETDETAGGGETDETEMSSIYMYTTRAIANT